LQGMNPIYPPPSREGNSGNGRVWGHAQLPYMSLPPAGRILESSQQYCMQPKAFIHARKATTGLGRGCAFCLALRRAHAFSMLIDGNLLVDNLVDVHVLLEQHSAFVIHRAADCSQLLVVVLHIYWASRTCRQSPNPGCSGSEG